MPEEKKPLKLKVAAAPASTPAPVAHPRFKDWRVLVVDDDRDIHSVTQMILGKLQYKGRGIALLSAYSAQEARQILQQDQNIAIVLLDVVMESDDAGLQLVRFIREELGNQAVRIILRTGQPGQAPEERVIIDYDINDYKAKSELTAQKLFTSVVAALRAYESIVSLEKTRKGLEKILDSTSTLFQVDSMQQFASGVLTQLSAFLDCQPNGVICVQFDPGQARTARGPHADIQILAATGEYSACLSCTMDDNCKHKGLIQLVRTALSEKTSQLTEDFTVLYLDTGNSKGTAALMHGGLGAADANDKRLLEVFSSKISIALANALHFQKMVSAEKAATTDFLTGLNNRRQLLRLGVPLVAGAFRSGAPMAVAMLDIDHFKNINDSLGHDAGDAVLQRMGQLLLEGFRASDVVARFGGEEFCIIAVNLERQAAFDLFDGFRRALEGRSFDIQGHRVPVSVSIGVTTVVNASVDTMISAADRMLYRAKQQGRNRVVID